MCSGTQSARRTTRSICDAIYMWSLSQGHVSISVHTDSILSHARASTRAKLAITDEKLSSFCGAKTEHATADHDHPSRLQVYAAARAMRLVTPLSARSARTCLACRCSTLVRPSLLPPAAILQPHDGGQRQSSMEAGPTWPDDAVGGDAVGGATVCLLSRPLAAVVWRCARLPPSCGAARTPRRVYLSVMHLPW